MAVTWRRPVQLYGPDRTQRLQARQLQARLQQSHVLRDDDYNLTHHHTQDAAWHTSSAIAFPGQKLDRSVSTSSMRQHDHHFKLGNDSGDFVPPNTYRESVTRGDFDMKPTTKTKVIHADKTIRWPVIAPQANPERHSRSSEYTSTFSVLQNRECSAPTFPKVNTFKMALPLDPTRFHVQRGSQFQLGCEQQSSNVSEIQRAYGKATSAGNTTHTLAVGDERRKFKLQELASSIFRPGDNNNTAGDMHTTAMIDYGPMTRPQGEMLGTESGQAQTRAHFQLGFDPEQKSSMYDKDYELSALATRSVPKLHPPPDAGHVLQKDDEYRNLPKTSQRHHFMKPTPLESSVNAGVPKNRLRNSDDSIILSCDTSRHAQDRQLSLSHSDYQRPPPSYRPSTLKQAFKVPFLHTKIPLPYSQPARESETANNYSGVLAGGVHAMDRRRSRDDVCRERILDTKATHFVVGYNQPEFTSHNSLTFQRRENSDNYVRPSGIVEIQPEADFVHLEHSANIQDDHVVGSQDANITGDKNDSVFTSVMKSDYTTGNTLTTHQLRSVEKYEKLLAKPFAESHFFHTDNSGGNNYITTAMDDFIKPEEMTEGRNRLAAK